MKAPGGGRLAEVAAAGEGMEQERSGETPIWSISWNEGERYLATVTKRAEPSLSSNTLWKETGGGRRKEGREGETEREDVKRKMRG